MEHIASYQRKPFLKDHPPIMQTAMLVSTAAEQKLLAGTVLGIKDDKHAPLSTGFEANAILAEDIVIPANSDTHALVYVHAEIIADALIWVDGTTPAQQKTALASLRLKGIYISEA